MLAFFYLLTFSFASQCSFDKRLSNVKFAPTEVCSNDHIAASLENIEGCKPRPVIIQIPWPNNTNVQQMTPTHVQINRCGGGCHRPGQRCFPTKKKTTEIAVMFGECGISTGRCDKWCSHVDVEEDTECECDCEDQEEDCGDVQEFNEDQCKCLCSDQKARQNCLDMGKT
jgi:hypothetical protein